MTINLSEIAKKKKIKYFLISYVDFFGILRSKLVPAHSIKEMQKEGAGFAGFSTYLICLQLILIWLLYQILKV